MRDYPTLHEALAIHAEVIRAYGGSNGVRDPRAIETALFRPQMRHVKTLEEKSDSLTCHSS